MPVRIPPGLGIERIEAPGILHTITQYEPRGSSFISALGRSFQQVQLSTCCIDLEGCRSPQASPAPYSAHRPLKPGQEAAIRQVLLMGPEHLNEEPIVLKFNRREVIRMPPAVLRVFSSSHADPETFKALLAAVGKLNGGDKDLAMDLVERLTSLVHIALTIPQLGMSFVIPEQLVDNDDVWVENLAPDNRMFLLGVVRSPI